MYWPSFRNKWLGPWSEICENLILGTGHAAVKELEPSDNRTLQGSICLHILWSDHDSDFYNFPHKRYSLEAEMMFLSRVNGRVILEYIRFYVIFT